MKTLIVLISLATAISAQPALRLKKSAAEPRDPGPMKARTLGKSHRIIQFEQAVTQEAVRDLEFRGIKVVRYLPDTGLVVVAEDNTEAAPAGLIRNTPMQAGEKLSAELALDALEDEAVVVVEFHPDVSDADARAVVLELGLEIQENADLLPGHLLIKGAISNVAHLAEWDEVAYIFPASAELLDGSPIQVCAGPLTDFGPIGQYVSQVGNGWDGPGANAVKLGYSFARLTQRLPEDSVKTTILRVLAEWSRVVQIHFEQTAGTMAPRSLNFLFATGAHGDGFSFDGPGRVLAHTFYPAPPNPEPLAGDMHFDDDENWQYPESVDLYSVALHELGHALGLGHSDKPGAVMYPYYRKLDKLTAEDIQAIQRMYAATVPEMQPPSTPPPASPVKDTVAPSLTIISPASTSVFTSASSIVVRGTASDNVGVTAVSWSTATGAKGTASGTTSWSTPALPLFFGTTTITIRAKDAAGNTGWRSLMVTRR